MAVSSFSKVDEYGFERPDDFDYRSYETFMSTYLKVLANRAKKWSEILGDGNSTLSRNATVKRYVRKGIPGGHRSTAWTLLSGARSDRERAPRLYERLLDAPFQKEIVDSIKTDLPRTFPDNIYFNRAAKHQTHLFHVLAAYAHDNRDVGYCQGLNYIAGLLLLVTNDEETSFRLLKVLVERILPNYYTRTMDGLAIDIEVFAELVRLKVPDVHAHIQNIGYPWGVICTKWFVCLYAEVLPTETVLRIWDCLFYEGSKILFRVAITLVKKNKASILQCDDFSTLSVCFKEMVKDRFAVDCHVFMRSIFKVPGSLSNNTISQLRERFAKERLEKKNE